MFLLGGFIRFFQLPTLFFQVAAELFGVPATELDEEKVAAYQETMLGGQKSTTALQPETAKPISRRHKTEYEKELKEDSRAFRPS